MYWVAASVGDERVRTAYEDGGGFCLPHVVLSLPHARRSAIQLMADILAERLEKAGPDSLLTLIAALDPDAAARRSLRALLPAGDGNHVSTIGRLRRRFAIAACPVCLAVGQVEQRFLAWLCDERKHRPDVLSEESHVLCPSHFHDLAKTDAEAAHWLARWTAKVWLGELSRVRERLTESRSAKDALASLRRFRPCTACAAVRTAEDRTTRLVLAALADPPTARAYEDSHGLCLRHVLPLSTERTADLVRSIARARLGLLAWELEEALRKSSWQTRHEHRGAEATAWLRAAALLDGRIFLGGPAHRPWLSHAAQRSDGTITSAR